MQQLRIAQKSITLVTLLSLAGAIFASPSTTASTVLPRNSDLTALKQTAFPNLDKYHLAQVSNNCRQIVAKYGLYVRQQPTVYSTAIGTIANGRYVTIEEDGVKGWVRISAPLKGYVFADYLTSCQAAPPPPSNCRQVSAKGGVYVRKAPTTNSAVIGTVASRRYVTIENPSTNRWLRISAPLKGYIFSDYLTSCS